MRTGLRTVIMLFVLLVSCSLSLFILISLTSCEGEYDDEITKKQIIESEDANQSQCESSKMNLLENGGFEDWISLTSYDMPEGWFCHNNYNVRKNREIVYESNYSAKMNSLEIGSTARIDQIIGVVSGHKLNICFRYYVEQWKSKGARTYCYFRSASAEKYDIPNNELEAFYDKSSYYIIRGGGYGLTYLPHELNCWQTFDETIEVPPTANYFVFGINSYYGTTIYVDDCEIFDVTEQASKRFKDVHM